MAILSGKVIAARYKEAARIQGLVDRYRAAAEPYKKGDRVKVKPSHGVKEWRGEVGTIDKYVPFSKYYVTLDKSGRQMVDQGDLEPLDSRKASVDDAFKDAAYPFLRESRFSWLAMGMAEEAAKGRLKFGMRDAADVLKAWFAGRKPEGLKEEAGYRFIQGGSGKLLMNGLIKGVTDALKATGARVGLKDVGEVIVAFAEDK